MQQILQPSVDASENDVGIPIRCAVSVNRRLTIVGCRPKWVSVFDSASGGTVSTFRVGKSGITSLIFDSDESWLACAMGTSNDAGLKIYSSSWFSGSWSPRNFQSGVLTEPIASIPLAGIRELCLSDDERSRCAGLISGEIAVIDTETWTVNGRWKGHEQGIYALDTRVSLLVSDGSDGWVQCWNTDTRQLVCEWKAHSLCISNLKHYPNAARVYTASFDETTTIWNLDGNLLSRLNGHSVAVRSLDVSLDGETLATGGDDHTVRRCYW